jgi:hypothetical protein
MELEDRPMTEEEWLACEDPRRMMEAHGDKISDRKLRLFACACCRRIWRRLCDKRSQSAVLTAELYADSRCSLPELTQALADAQAAYNEGSDAFYTQKTGITVEAHAAAMHAADTHRWRLRGTVDSAAYSVFKPGSHPYSEEDARIAVVPEYAAQAVLLRDITGNPFKPYPVPPAWPLTIIDLAQALYDGHDNRLILADALEESGHEELARHFRQEEWHPKGCWVMDAILGQG